MRALAEQSLPAKAASALRELEGGMQLKKCWKCGCMDEALTNAEAAFGSGEEPEIHGLLPRIAAFRERMLPIAYDCLGCKKCWGADATIQLANHFEDVDLVGCGTESAPAAPRVNGASTKRDWPPVPGDYIVGNPAGSVAICTLSSRELPREIIAAAKPAVAIAGRCDTENIGIEKVVLNSIANANIRWLVLCGTEAKGHRTGDAFLRLKERGVDADMRVLESASWRPVLKNLTLLDVTRFREQIEIVNLVGEHDCGKIIGVANECAARAVPELQERLTNSASPSFQFERITARAPKGLRLDKAGFFIVLPQRDTGEIVCEHYENSGRLAHVITGWQANVIAATAVEKGFITQLDHAAYLGRELAKAEMALSGGGDYEQDAALGALPTANKEQPKTSKPPHESASFDNECGCG
jgi:tetrahydromethanopterin S-methyltransferase subunit A